MRGENVSILGKRSFFFKLNNGSDMVSSSLIFIGLDNCLNNFGHVGIYRHKPIQTR